MRNFISRLPVSVRYALGVLAILLLSLGAFKALMSPPPAEIGLMALFLAITAVISSIAGYLAYRLGWMSRSPALRWTLLGGYALSSVLTFFNVWFSARMMFASQHDLLLATVLLVFAGGMAMSLGYFLSNTITDRIHALKNAAESLARGNLQTHVPISGRDEVAMLAMSFNQMASQLQASDQKQRDLEQSRKDLIAWASHDLQTPLASIRAILEALGDDIVEDPQAVKHYLLIAQRDVRSLSALIDDLFQMAQLDAGGIPLNLEESSLTDLISDTLESFSELAARQNIIITGHVDSDVDPLRMDTMRIGRVLNNLLSNALQHISAGGKIEIVARRMGRGVAVSVSDTGEGIRAEDLPRIFERFYRGEKSRNRNTGGSGLGLSISRGIIRAHQGEITVESISGHGTRFEFTLP